VTATTSPRERTLADRFRDAWPRWKRPVRDALVIVGLLRAFVFFFVQGEQPWTFWGVDARAYWRIDLAHPYTDSAVGELSNYLYSPAFAQLLAPLSVLPFELFFALWFVVSFAILVWLVKPWPWIVPMLLLPIVYELCVGNIHFLLALVFTLVLRAPGLWAFPLLTKITPAVGGLWHVVRGEWRAVAVAAGATAVVVGVSFVINPSAWIEWLTFLAMQRGQSELLLPRVLLAAALVMWGARTGRPWTIAVAGWFALPVVWVNAWVILLAVVRLRDPKWMGPEMTRT
jgi:hypothetical protein